MPKNVQYALAALDVYFIRKELSLFVGSRVSRIYGRDKQLTFVFSTKNEKKTIFSIDVPENMSFVLSREIAPENPSGTIVALRNALEGAIVTAVVQAGFDRILRMSFAGREPWTLVFELFSHGNWFLLDGNGSIMIAQAEVDWKDRSLHRGKVYAPPKPALNLPALDELEFYTRLVNSTRDSIVKALAVDAGLGGLYAEELCLRTGIDKKQPIKSLSHKDVFLLRSSLASMFALEPRGYVYSDAITPLPLLSREGALMQECPSFLEARARAIAHVKTRSELELERTKAVMANQVSAVEELAAAQVLNARKAEWLYEHYAPVVAVLAQLRQGGGRTPEQVAELLAAQGLQGSLDLAKGVLRVHVPEGLS